MRVSSPSDSLAGSVFVTMGAVRRIRGGRTGAGHASRAGGRRRHYRGGGRGSATFKPQHPFREPELAPLQIFHAAPELPGDRERVDRPHGGSEEEHHEEE
jgi:hypothetical protein